jgi:hypothetical protein
MGQGNRAVARAVLSAGLVAGTADIVVACLIYRLSPGVILHSIASGLIGKSAFAGGVATALLGLVLQWIISILIAMIYLAVTVPLPHMRRRWRLSGALAGAVIYLVMSYIVVPLSAAPFRPRSLHDIVAAFTLYNFVVSFLAMIVFGLIIAFFVRDCAPASPRVTAAS